MSKGIFEKGIHMTEQQWKIFCDFKEELKQQIQVWSDLAPELGELQKAAAEAAKTPEYPFETTVVYNRALDEITPKDDIRLIVIGDNPGKDEQLKKNNKYLVGQAGKIAEGYFRKNPCLNVDFRKNVIILNKTPIHSAKTNQLKTIAKQGGKKIADLIEESQIWMAQRTAKLHVDLCNASDSMENQAELWLVGYSELKEKGIFGSYRRVLKSTYLELSPATWEKVFVFQHFSMNRFPIDLNEYIRTENKEAQPLELTIRELGLKHKTEIFV